MFISIKKFYNQYNKMLFVGLIVVLGIFILVCSSFFSKGTTQELVAKEPVALMSEETYLQELRLDRNASLESISLRFATFARVNQGKLCLSLYSNNQLVEKWELDVSKLGDYEYYEFDLTSDLKVNKKDDIFLEIYEVYEGDNAIAIITAEDVENPLYRNKDLVNDRAICYKISYSESMMDFICNNLGQIIIVLMSVVLLRCLWKRCQSGKGCDYLLLLLTIVSAMFAVLYFPYISGENVYLYADIGCDTIDQYWPTFLFALDFIRETGHSGYSLQWGFGQYIDFINSIFLNPFDWSFLVFDKVKSLVISLYLKIIITAFFAWKFFRRKFETKETALICAILWTFSGWFIVWGQHHSFARHYSYFTIILFFLELLIEKSKYVVFFPFILALLTSESYYFTYMIGVFCIIYVLVVGVVKRSKIREVFNRLILLGAMEVVAILLSLIKLYPSIYNFMTSGRTAALDVAQVNLFQPRDISMLIAYVGRMLSSNMWGVKDYTGPYNYYEMAISYSSCLIIVAVIYFFFSKRKRQMCGLLLGCVFLIMMPIISKVIQFAEDSYRWTFFLNAVNVLLIGSFFEKIWKDIKEKEYVVINKTIITSNIVIAGLICAIVFVSRNSIWGFRADEKAIVQVCVVWGVLNLVILVFKLTKSTNWKKAALVSIIFVSVEGIFMNYYAVNERGEISAYSMKHGYYNDGTSEIVELLKERDSSLYRVNKTYYSVFYNDAYVQDYNSVSSYFATNSASLNEFVHNLDIENLNNRPSYVSIDADDVYVNELLAVKYLIAKENELVSDGYKQILKKGDLVLYEDTNTLPFGYLYTQQLSTEQYDMLDGTEEKSSALMRGFYYIDVLDGYETVEIVDENHNVETGREKLKGTRIQDVSFGSNTYTSRIVNDTGEKAMLCVPLIYDSRWNAFLNEDEVKIYNINGGLIGVEIPEGEYSVKIVYNTEDYNIVQSISCVSWIAYMGFLMCCLKKMYFFRCKVE